MTLVTIHKAGVQHNDIHTRNILTDEHKVKIADFSVSTAHSCQGMLKCKELVEARQFLRLPLSAAYVAYISSLTHGVAGWELGVLMLGVVIVTTLYFYIATY